MRERTTDRMSAPSSPTLDIDKMDSAVQASLSLPATPVGKGLEHSFIGPKGSSIDLFHFLKLLWAPRWPPEGSRCLIFASCSCAALTNGCGSSSLTPSARISALNIVADLLRKVGVGVFIHILFFACS